MEESRDRADELINRMKAARGYIYPAWEFAARADPDFAEAYQELYEQGLSDGKALSAGMKELIAIGILAFRGNPASVKTHIRRAMRLGATRQELLEAIETCLLPGGAPAFHCGLKALMEALEEEEGQGDGKP